MAEHPLVFLILAHTDPTHLARLVDRLGTRDRVLVHVDAKSDIGPFEHLGERPNVELLGDRVEVNWCGLSVVEATLRLIERALALSPDAGHLVLLSGADYPIKPVERLRELLAAHPDAEFLNIAPMPRSDPENRWRLDRRWWWDVRRPRRPWLRRQVLRSMHFSVGRIPTRGPSGPIHHGSTWWALTAKCCEHIVESRSEHRELERFLRRAWAPDEIYVPTVVALSPFASRAGLTESSSPSIAALANLHVIHHSLAHWYTVEDFERIAASKLFFVRKVSTARSAALLDLIDEKLLAIT